MIDMRQLLHLDLATSSSATAFSLIVLPPSAATSWFAITACIYQLEGARLAYAALFYEGVLVLRCDVLGRFEPVQ
jgi:hypothetical protein